MSESLLVTFIGVQGPAGVGGGGGGGGSTIRSGSGAPASALGNDGDLYIDNTNNDYYTKASGSWTLQGNSTGATGAAGADGATGPQGPAGADGATGPQGPEGPTGPTGAAGADGATGPAGADGADGTQISDGENDPGSGNPPASPGDYFFQTVSGDLWRATGDGTTWTVVGNYTGPQGATGPAGAPGADGANGADGSNGTDGADGTGEFAQEFYDTNGLDTNTEPILRPIEQACTIQSLSLLLDVADTMTVRVRRYTPSAGSLGAATLLGTISVSAAQHNRLTGLSWAVAAGDVIELDITVAPTTAIRAGVALGRVPA